MANKPIYTHTERYDNYSQSRNNMQNRPRKSRQFKNQPNKSFFGKLFRSKDGKLNLLGKAVIGIGASAIIAAGVGAGIDQIKQNNELNDFVNGEYCSEIVDAAEENYLGSQYLQVSLPRDSYMRYVKEVLKDTVKNETGLKEFLKENGDLDGDTLAYILTGEGNRDNISGEELLAALKSYSPYKSEVSFNEKGEPNSFISLASSMTNLRLSEANVKNFVALIDAALGSDSIANSKAALEYKKSINNEMTRGIERYSESELDYSIYTNNNFERLVEDEPKTYLEAYVKFGNSRVGFVQDLFNNELNLSEGKSNILKKVLEEFKHKQSFTDYSKIKDTILYLQSIETMEDIKIASREDYKAYRECRNSFYEDIKDAKKNPIEATATLNADNEKIDNQIDNQEFYTCRTPSYLKELDEVFRDMQNVNERVNRMGLNGGLNEYGR